MKLRQIINQLILRARLNKDATVHTNLKNGLRLDLRIHRTEYLLCFSRLDVFPSEVEIQTTLAHWPEDLPPAEDFKTGERRYNRWYSRTLAWEKPT